MPEINIDRSFIKISAISVLCVIFAGLFGYNFASLIASLNERISSLKIPKGQDKEVKELVNEITELKKEIKNVKEAKEGTVEEAIGGVGSKITVHRNLGKLFKKETPSGTKNGLNKIYTLTRAPFANFIILERNGVGQTGGGIDFTLSGNQITYNTALQSDETHYAIYF